MASVHAIGLAGSTDASIFSIPQATTSGVFPVPNPLCRVFILTLSILLFGIATVRAEAPPAKTQVPGYYRYQLGQFEITALFDGIIELDTSLLKTVTPADLKSLLARSFVGNPKMQTAVNAYLINTGAHLVLVDAGAVNLFGPSLGHIIENMKAAGHDPSQIDTVIATHLHGDHVGGLINAEGQPVFLKAQIMVPRADHEFWLSQAVADKAEKSKRPFFKMARDAAAPYQAAGRWQPFSDGAELVPGLRAVAANGHTPGHSAYAVESKGEHLLIWGDLVHAHAVQFAKPGVAIEFDVDQKKAIATRRAVFKSVAASRTLVAGMHLPFPGLGHVSASGKDSYVWVPIEFSPLPQTNTP